MKQYVAPVLTIAQAELVIRMTTEALRSGHLMPDKLKYSYEQILAETTSVLENNSSEKPKEAKAI